jgi:hypothetical protein
VLCTNTEWIPIILFHRKRRLIFHLELSLKYVKLHIQSSIRLHVVISNYSETIIFFCHIDPQSEEGNYFRIQPFFMSQRSIYFAVPEGATNSILQTG